MTNLQTAIMNLQTVANTIMANGHMADTDAEYPAARVRITLAREAIDAVPRHTTLAAFNRGLHSCNKKLSSLLGDLDSNSPTHSEHVLGVLGDLITDLYALLPGEDS